MYEDTNIDMKTLYYFLGLMRASGIDEEAIIDKIATKLGFSHEKVKTILDACYEYLEENEDRL